MGTILLVVLLFTEKLHQLPLAEKTLGILLLLFPLVQFFIYAYAGLKWPTLSHFIDNTFISPGNSINLSDTRGTIAFYPVFVFFIFCFPVIKKGIESHRVKQVLLGIVAINLIVVIAVFAGPRIKFIVENIDKSYEQLAETPGPSDLPNQYQKTYQVAYQLREKFNKNQTLFLPPSDREGTIRSVLSQVLFGEALIFSDDPDFRQNLKNKGSKVYALSRNEGKDELCHGVKGEDLGNTGFILCRLNN